MVLKRNPYQVLGVREAATTEEIRRAFRRQARVYHPDANPGNPAAAERFKEAVEAYELLCDPRRRAAFDRAQRVRTARPEPTRATDPRSVYAEPHRRPRPARPYPEQTYTHPTIRSLFDLLETSIIASFFGNRTDLRREIEEDWAMDWGRRFSLLDLDDE